MKIKNLMIVILGCICCALALVVFFQPFHFVPGGVSGIAVIFESIFNVDLSLSIFILSSFLLLFSFIFLGKDESFKSINGLILLPAFVFLFSMLLKNVNINLTDKLLASVFGGILLGLGIGLVYKAGYTTGGSEIIAKIINKYFHLSLGTSTFIIDGLITLSGIFVFGLETFIYSIIAVYIASIVINKVMSGIFGNKSFYIITTKPDAIKKFIVNDLGHGATIIDGHGAYSNESKSIILAVIPTADYYKLKEGLAIIDKDAFFTVSESYEVGGGK